MSDSLATGRTTAATRARHAPSTFSRMAPDRIDRPRERHPPGHRHGASHRLSCRRRDQRGGQRHPHRRAVLPPGGLRQVHVHVGRVVQPHRAGEAFRVRAHPRHRDVRRSPHHRPARPGDVQRPAAGKARRLDEQHVTALAGDGHTRGQRRDGGSGPRPPHRGTAAPGATRTSLPVPSPRAAAAPRPAAVAAWRQSPSMPSSRRRARGSCEEPRIRNSRAAGENDSSSSDNPCCRRQARDQVHGRDPLLLRVGVAGQRQPFRPLPLQRRDAPGVGRDGDEQQAAQVQRQADVAVAEAVVAGRLERAE